MILESFLHQRGGEERPRTKSRVASPGRSRGVRNLYVLLKVSGFLGARDAHPYGMVPAARRYGAPVRGAAVTHALSAGSAVMDGETGVKLTLALIAATDVLVGNPVRRPRRVFNQAWWRRQNHNVQLSAKIPEGLS